MHLRKVKRNHYVLVINTCTSIILHILIGSRDLVRGSFFERILSLYVPFQSINTSDKSFFGLIDLLSLVKDSLQEKRIRWHTLVNQHVHIGLYGPLKQRERSINQHSLCSSKCYLYNLIMENQNRNLGHMISQSHRYQKNMWTSLRIWCLSYSSIRTSLKSTVSVAKMSIYGSRKRNISISMIE